MLNEAKVIKLKNYVIINPMLHDIAE